MLIICEVLKLTYFVRYFLQNKQRFAPGWLTRPSTIMSLMEWLQEVTISKDHQDSAGSCQGMAKHPVKSPDGIPIPSGLFVISSSLFRQFTLYCFYQVEQIGAVCVGCVSVLPPDFTFLTGMEYNRAAFITITH
jgi:hypothetical protein